MKKSQQIKNSTSEKRFAVPNKKLLPELESMASAFLKNLEAFDFPEQEKGLKSLLSKLRKRKINVIVVSDFNRGKSMFVNSLLRRDYLPTGITPTTSNITRVAYGSREKITVFYLDGETVEITPQAFSDLEAEDCHAIHHIDILLPDPFLEYLTFIDTPGVNDPDEHKIEILYEFIPKADILVFLLGCDQAFTRSERIFLTEKLLRNDLRKILVVLNKADLLRDESEKKHLFNHLNHHLGTIMDIPQIIPFSAQAALEAHIEGDNEALLQSNFPALQEILENELHTPLLVDSAFHKLAAILNRLKAYYQLRETQSQKTLTELQRDIEQLNENKKKLDQVVKKIELKAFREIDKLCDRFMLDIKEFAIKFSKDVPAQLDGISQEDAQRYLNFFIQDMYKQFIEEKEEEIHGQILAAVEKLLDEVDREVQDTLLALRFIPAAFIADVEYQERLSRFDKIRLAVSVTSVGAFVFNLPIGSILLSLSELIGKLFKGKADKKFLAQVVTQTQYAIMESAKNVEAQIRRSFTDVQQIVGGHIQDSYSASFDEITKDLKLLLEQKEDQDYQQEALKEQQHLFSETFAPLNAQMTAFAEKNFPKPEKTYQ